MSGGEADGGGGIASTSKDEEDIFPIPPSHAYAISIVIWEKQITPFFTMGGIDQYTPSSRGGVLTNIPPWEDFTIVSVGVPWKISSHPEQYDLFFSLLQCNLCYCKAMLLLSIDISYQSYY